MNTANQIRQAYLKYFEKRGHAIVPSASLVPENDPTTLFTGSGMQPMVPYLLGQPHPKGNRIVDSQKAFRSQDIEEVGDNRHTTFFEMLGNWSLGDYFKKEQLRWIFEFLTDEVGLEPKKIYTTVFRGNEALGVPRDTESVEIWKELFKEKGIEAKDIDFADRDGMQGGRIFYYEEKKNWWSRAGAPDNMPAGEPGGPDSELFYDFGVELKLHENSTFKDQPCHVNCDCGRFLEIGNSVFMQYQKQPDGTFTELPQKNVDFGGGLERILAPANRDPDVFKTDIFIPIITEIENVTNRKYEENTTEMRIIADHLRAAVFLTKDGVRPSNKEQGYFLRRLIRRAIVKLHQLNSETDPVGLVTIADEGVLATYDGLYFNRKVDQATIQEVLQTETAKFSKSLDKGLRVLEKADHIDGTFAFDLYQTYGFPLEITVELAQQKGHQVDVEEFKNEFNKHKDLSRTASAGMFKGGLQDDSAVTVKYHTATHLLQAALRKVLGTHVQQKGSNITKDRLRFDFSHEKAITQEEQDKIMQQIQEWIDADLPVTRQEMSKTAALDSGAIAFFVEKYPDQVSVYTVGNDPDNDWISKELCGGPHVTRTGEIGQLIWQKEQAVAAGVRRVYLQSL